MTRRGDRGQSWQAPGFAKRDGRVHHALDPGKYGLQKIVVVQGRHAGAELALEGPSILVLGSGPGAHLRLGDAGVHETHVRLFREPDRLLFFDESGAGVRLNGKTTAQGELRPGDELAIGPAVVRLTATPATGASLRVLKGPDEGKEFPLLERATLGRGVTADIPLLDMKCSREHCRVEKSGDGYALVDLGSTNGTRLNDAKVDSGSTTPLRHGDRLRLGGTVIEFHADATATAGAAPRPPLPPTPTPTSVGRSASSSSGRLNARPRDVSRVDQTVRISTRPLTNPLPQPAIQLPPPGEVFEIDLDAPDEAPPPVPPAGANPKSPTFVRVTAPKSPAAPPPSLEGLLENMSFPQLVQFLNLSRKSGELTVDASGTLLGIAFVNGEVQDCWGGASSSAEAVFHRIVRLRSGRFDFRENRPPRPVRIKQSTMALLMEAMRLVDEATDSGPT